MTVAAPPAVIAVVDRDVLLSLLHSCGRAIAKHSRGIPILRCVRASFGDGRLTMRATNLDLTIDCSGVAESAEPWQFVCDHGRLTDLVKTLPPGEVRLSADGLVGLNVSAGLAKITIPVEKKPDDYPLDPELGVEQFRFEIEASELVEMLHAVSFVTGEGEVRFRLDGAVFRAGGKGLEVFATDGKRLSVFTLQRKRIGSKVTPFMLSRTAVVAVEVREWDDEVPVVVAVHENQITIESGPYRLCALISDFNVPSIEESIPRNTIPAIVDRASLLSSLRRIGNVSNEHSRCISLDFEKGRLTLSARSDRGKATERIPADYSGEPEGFGFNGTYLTDFLSLTDSATVEIGIVPGVSGLAPAVVRPIDLPEGRDWFFLIGQMERYQ